MMTDTPLSSLPAAHEVRQQAIQTLIQQLGITKASIFLSLVPMLRRGNS